MKKLILIVLLALAGCGGGGGSTTIPTLPEEPVIVTPNLDPIGPDLVPPLPPDNKIMSVQTLAAVEPRIKTTTIPNYNYTQYDGAYNCNNPDRISDPFSADFKFTAIDVYWYGKFSTGVEGYARYNDIVEFINDHPSYSENQPIGVNLYSIWFTSGGILHYSAGPKTDSSAYYPDRLWTCTKIVVIPPPGIIPRVKTTTIPNYNYAQHNGAYDCTNLDRISDKFPADFKFTATDVYWFGKFSSGAEGYARYNDLAEFVNGYPSYSENQVTGINLYSVWFSPDGVLQYSSGSKTDTSSYFTGRRWSCTKSVTTPPAVCYP
jgi:hypothetical protein